MALDKETYRKIFWFMSAIMLIIMLFLSKDFGMNWDESGFSLYGEKIAKFYLSLGQDKSVLEKDPNYDIAILYYGGFFEFLVWSLTKIIHSQVYIARHGLTAFFGFLAILFTGLTAKELTGWKTGILAMLLIFLTPVFLGNSMHSFKDIPFAASYIISIYYLVKITKELPSPNYKTIALLTASIGLAISLRVGGVIILVYLLLFWFIKTIYTYFLNKSVPTELVENGELIEEQNNNSLPSLQKFIKNSILFLFIIFVGSYFIGIFFWPYALLHPFTGVLESLRQLSNVQYWNGYPLFNGEWYNSWAVPWNYIPVWVLITTPLFIPLSFICLLIALSKKAWSKEDLIYLLIIVFSALFPVVYVIIKKSNLYDSWRHLYFIYPSIVVVAAAGIDKSLALLDYSSKIFLVILLGIFIIEPTMFMARNYPNYSFYFSPIIGGIKGAFKNYEIDYYGTSLRSAVEWVAKDSETVRNKNNVKIKNWYGGASSIDPFIKSYKNLGFTLGNDWDYSFILLSQAKADKKIFENWPPKDAVYEVKVDEVTLVAILKHSINTNTIAKTDDVSSILNQPSANTTTETLINLSLKLINDKDNCNAIIACEKAIELEPNNSIAYNNMCIAYNNLFIFDEAELAGKKALELNPQFELAKNNYNFTLSRKNDPNAPKLTVDTLINLSLAFYNAKMFDKSILFAKKALEIQPNNPIVYNNLCVFYIGANKIDEAISAGEMAIKLDPNSSLAKANLDWAKSLKK